MSTPVKPPKYQPVLPGEEWRPIRNYEGFYEVSNLGRVRSLGFCRGTQTKVMKNTLLSIGYYSVGISKNKKSERVFIHRLIMEAFTPNPNNLPQVNHKNGDKADNRLENLEWCTAKENIRHAFSSGLVRNIARGIRSGKAKITEHDVRVMRKLWKMEFTKWGIGLLYGISGHQVGKIVEGKSWEHA